MNPPQYTDGLEEMIRAQRLYLGLSKDGMAAQLKINSRTYDRIESGERDCPPGFLDSMDDIITRFEDELLTWTEYTDKHGSVEVPVSMDPREEWTRAVVGRAAVETQRIMPVKARVTTPTTIG